MNKSKLNDIKSIVSKTGQNPVSGTIYDLVQTWKSWYIGDVADFHHFKYKNVNGTMKQGEKLTFGIPKKIGEDWISLLWNENVSLLTSEEDYNKRLKEVFASNKLRVELGGLLEKVFTYAGWGATVEYLVNGETVIDYITSEYAMITEGVNTTARGIVTINEIEKADKYITHLQYHYLEDGKYVVEHKAYVSDKETELGNYSRNALASIFNEEQLNAMQQVITNDDGEVIGERYVVMYDTDIPTFQIYRPNITNNYNTASKEGIPVTANCIDSFKALDNAYTALDNEINNNKTLTVFSDKAVRIKTVADPNTGTTQYIQYIDDNNTQFIASPMNDNEDWVKRFKGEFTSESYVATINRNLSWISFKVGLGTGFYSFDGTNTYVNEKQIISTNNDTWKNKVKHEIVLRDALEGLIKAVIFLEQSMGRLKTKDYEVMIKFDDSIIQDDDTKKKESLDLVEKGMKPEWKHLVDWEGLTEEEAKAQVKEATGINVSRLKAINDAVSIGAMSIEQSQRLLNPDMSEEELEIMYIRTLVEKGIPITLEQSAKYNNRTLEEEIEIQRQNRQQRIN